MLSSLIRSAPPVLCSLQEICLGSFGSLLPVGGVNEGCPMGLQLIYKQPMSTAPSSEDTRRSNASGLQCDVLRTLVKNNADDDAISTYLGALSSLQTASYREQIDRYRDEIARTREERLQEIDRYRDEIARYREQKLQLQLQLQQEIGHYREEILRLQGDLKTTNAQYSGEVKFLTERLQTTMAQYLRLQGLLSMRGIMEYIQNTMFERTDVKWDRFQAMSCWQDYVNQRPSLQKCLMKRGLVVDTAGGDLVAVYKTLSNNIHDSMTPDEYQKSDSVLYIGAPLLQKQREVIACLCEDVQVAYKVMPVAPVTSPNEA